MLHLDVSNNAPLTAQTTQFSNYFTGEDQMGIYGRVGMLGYPSIVLQVEGGKHRSRAEKLLIFM